MGTVWTLGFCHSRRADPWYARYVLTLSVWPLARLGIWMIPEAGERLGGDMMMDEDDDDDAADDEADDGILSPSKAGTALGFGMLLGKGDVMGMKSCTGWNNTWYDGRSILLISSGIVVKYGVGGR